MSPPTPTPRPDGPVRTCLGCRRRAPQDGLLRFVADGAVVVVDPSRRASGRGAYVHPDAACVTAAVRRRAFGRALRAPVDAAAAGETLTAYLDRPSGRPPAREG